jgi:beta-aspartyl-peptidase (threonine type)
LEGRILVHGGAGFWKKQVPKGLAGVREAASEGLDLLRRGATALEAVEAAVIVMEDDPVFNAGKGSSLTASGSIEMDAGIMDGHDLSAGAVALIRRVKNPIRLARIVMEKTDHVLLAGQEAEKLARAFGLPERNQVTQYRKKLLLEVKKGGVDERISWVRKNRELLSTSPKLMKLDTVGAVAVDEEGDFAAAASTGGPTMKLPGRIGDTPVIGSGLYCDNRAGAATVTGLGEIAIKLAMSRTVCLRMEMGASARTSAHEAVKSASKRLRGDAGVIAIDRKGGVASVHNTPCMPWASADTRSGKLKAWPHGEIIFPVQKSA